MAWILVFVLVSYAPDGHFRTERAEIGYESATACLTARDWWFDHPEATPPGYDPRWDVLIGPDCFAADALTS
jgi:hypothetical protein